MDIGGEKRLLEICDKPSLATLNDLMALEPQPLTEMGNPSRILGVELSFALSVLQ